MEQANTVILDLEEYKRLYEISKVFEKGAVIKHWLDYNGINYSVLDNDEAINELTNKIDSLSEKLKKMQNDEYINSENSSCKDKNNCSLLKNYIRLNEEKSSKITALENEIRIYRRGTSNKNWFKF